MSYWNLFLVLLGTVAQLSLAVNIRTMCRGHPYGTLLPNPQDCNSYYICQSGPQLAYCDHGLHFDRIHKVCNWPNWANCILEEAGYELESEEEFEPASIEDERNSLEEENPDKLLEVPVNQPVEEPASEGLDKSPESLNVVENVGQPSHIQLSKELSSKELENDKLNSHGINVLIVSSISKDPTDSEVPVKVPAVTSANTPDVESVASSNGSNPAPNSTLVIQIPVAVPTEVPNLDSKPSTGTILEVQVPVVAGSPEAEIVLEKEESVPELPVKVPNEETAQVIVVLEDLKPLKPSKNSSQVMELPGPIFHVEIPTVIGERPQPEVVTDLPKPSLVQTVEVPSSIVDSQITFVDIPQGEVVVEKVESVKPSPGSYQIVEQVGSVDISNPIVDTSNGNAGVHETEVVIEKVESSKPSADSNQVIDLIVPVDIPNPIVETSNTIVEVPEPQVVVEKVNPSKPTDSNQVIELAVPALPVEVSSSNAESSQSVVGIPQGEVAVEKVEVSASSQSSNQVIELAVPALPVEVSSSNAESSQPVVGIPQGEVAVEKVEVSTSSQSSNQVIELAVPALPVEVSSSNVESSQPVVGIPQGEVAVEKVEVSTSSQSSNQVIELLVPSLPAEIPNVIVENLIPEAQAVVEKVETPSDPKPSQELLVEQSILVLPDNILNSVQIVVEKVESSSDPKPTQVIELPHPVFPADIVVVKPFKPEADSQQNLSQSSESIQLSEENSNSELAESSEESTEKLGANKLSSSSEEEVVEKVEASIEKEQVSSESSEDGNVEKEVLVLTHSHQSSEGVVEAVVDSPSSKEDTVLTNSYESSEEDVIEPNHQHHTHHSNVKEHGISLDSQASEEEQVETSSEEDLAKPLHLHPHHHHQSNAEKVEKPGGSSKPTKESSEVHAESSSEEDLAKPLHLHPHHHHQSNAEKVEKPSNPKPVKESLEESDEDIAPVVPKKTTVSTEDSNIPVESNVPFGKPLAPPTSSGQHSNLIASVLSVASFQGNGTINRPLVGAHSTETGHPIDTMTGYNTKHVQCIHDGLYFLPHPISCQKYFICAYRHLHLHSCGSDLTWSYKREQCDLESDSKCFSIEASIEPTPEPEKKPTKPARDTTEEITPVIKGKTTSTPMPPLRTTQSTAVTSGRDDRVPKCPAVEQVYLPSYYDCNKYYICILGYPVLTSCPDSLHWDAEGEFCGLPTLARCAGK